MCEQGLLSLSTTPSPTFSASSDDYVWREKGMKDLYAMAVGFCHVKTADLVQSDRHRTPEVGLCLRRDVIGSVQVGG